MMVKLVIEGTKNRVTIGRSRRNDYVVDHPAVSPDHAQLIRRDDQLILHDLQSQYGTYVNGHRIARALFVKAGDQIQIGPAQFEVGLETKEVGAADLRFSARIDVQGLSYDIGAGAKGRRLLNDLSFTILPGELVALMGPAGAGKTTLIEAMNGTIIPSAGHVLVNGRDLFQSFDAMRGNIGYVPQDDIVHRKLTLYEACYFTAKMRLPDLAEAELQRRISTVLAKLDILHLADRIIGSPESRVLSGGQRKRLNLAMEMVTDPALLFLDEPTSGLSSADAKGVLRVLRELRDAGRTIIITIHQPSRELFEMMDNVVLLGSGGRLVYYGPVLQSYERFDSAPNPDALFEKLSPARNDDDHWKALESEFRETHWYDEFVLERARNGGHQNEQSEPGPRAPKNAGLGQFLLLLERLAKLYTRDIGWMVGALVGAPLLMAFLTTQLNEPADRHTLLFVAVLLAYFFGIFPAIEMIQSEVAIFRRERMVNLKLPSYVLSKVVFLGLFGVAQAFAISAILTWFEGVDVGLANALLVLLSVQLCGATTGLFVSTVARTHKVALMLMLAFVIIMIAFSGFVVNLPGLREQGTAWLLALSPMRWGLGALMDVVGDVPLSKVKYLGFEHELWGLNLLVNVALAALPTAMTLIVLRLRDKVR